MQEIFLFILKNYLDIAVFAGVLSIFMIARYLLQKDIQSVSKQKNTPNKKKYSFGKYLLFQFIFAMIILFLYIISLALSIGLLQKFLVFVFSLALLHIAVLYIHKKILLYYGQEIEVSGEKYFRKGYEANLYSLFVNGISFIFAVLLFIRMFEIESFIQIGGLWAGILAFMGFTAPVWALDMIVGIILLQSKTILSQMYNYIEDLDIYV